MKLSSTTRCSIACSVFLALAGCTTTPTIAPPEVPRALQASAGQVVFLEADASGEQVYECMRNAGTAQLRWTQRGAVAELTDRSGRAVGRHYYPGPTWEAADGSKVVTEVKARAPAPEAGAVPWLLLAVKGASGEGFFRQTASIQRVHTQGGVAPRDGCEAVDEGKTVRVPYKAVFYFYKTVAVAQR